jgi:hypothetical protein
MADTRVAEALLNYLQASRELPADIAVPTRLVVARASFARVMSLVKVSRKPTRALRALMRGKRVGKEPASW